MKPERIVIIGTGRIACSCLEACLDRSMPVACVESENHAFSPLAAFCRKRGVEYNLTIERESLARFFLSISQPTLVVSAFNNFIFPKNVLENRALNVINFHNSLLPRHRGRNAPTWSIFEMDPVTGVTWHQVHAELDTGDVIAQRQIEVGSDITAIELTLKTLDLGAQMFLEMLPSLLDGSYVRKPVARSDKGSFHRSTDMPNGGVLDLGWSIERAHAFLRALDYGKFKVFAASKVRFFGADLPIVGYRIQKNCPAKPGEASIVSGNKRLVLRSQGTELSIICA